MLLELKDLSSIRKSAEIEVPAEAVKNELDKVTGEFARHAKLPGFRPGKIPTQVIRNKFQKEIQDEVKQRLLPRFFYEAVSEKGLEAVGNPELTRMDPILEGAPLRFGAEFEIKPVIELKEYRGLPVTEKPVEVTDAEVDEMINRFREGSGSFRPIEDRPAEEGDYALIDIVSSGQGLETRRTEDYHLHLGKDVPLPELNEHLIGKSAGHTATFQKTYGEDSPNEDVRGKTVSYDVTLKSVQARELPELNDEFAKSSGIAESIEELREKIREDIKRHKESEAIKAKQQQVGEALISSHEFEAPQVLIEEELGKQLRNYARFLQSQGIDLETAQIDWQKMQEEFRDEAVRRVKRQLILEAIARKENLSVSDVEVDAEIRRHIGRAEQSFAEVRHRLKHDGEYEALRASLLQERALELVLREAKVTPA